MAAHEHDATSGLLIESTVDRASASAHHHQRDARAKQRFHDQGDGDEGCERPAHEPPPLFAAPHTDQRAWNRGRDRLKEQRGSDDRAITRHTSNTVTANHVLRTMRLAHGWGQADVAERLNVLAASKGKSSSVTEGTVSRWERGETRLPDPLNRQLLADLFEVSLDVLGYADPSGDHTVDPVAEGAAPQPRVPHHVAQSQQDWRTARRHLNEQRVALTLEASRLYQPEVRLGSTGTLSPRDWRATAPVDLAQIELRWVSQPGTPLVSGREAQTTAVRPLLSEQRRFSRYTHALRAIDPPALFENRLGYRLLEVMWTDEGGRLTFGPTTYFENVDVGEAVAHELALARTAYEGDGGQPTPWRRLPFRRLLGDPFDLTRRPLLPSIDTLTIRRARASASFVLHQRDSRLVAVAGGMRHVMPAGVFQPASIYPTPQHDDFDLWRSTMREYSEEFLGNPDHDGTGLPVDYAHEEPFRMLDQARRAHRVRAFCFGIGLDALTLNGEILTAVVFEDDVFDEVFADLVNTNSEGTVLSTVDDTGRTLGLPFVESEIQRQLGSGSLAPAAAACLELAWAHRDVLLDPSVR